MDKKTLSALIADLGIDTVSEDLGLDRSYLNKVKNERKEAGARTIALAAGFYGDQLLVEETLKESRAADYAEGQRRRAARDKPTNATETAHLKAASA